VKRYGHAEFHSGAFSLPDQRALPRDRNFRSGGKNRTISAGSLTTTTVLEYVHLGVFQAVWNYVCVFGRHFRVF
jgi:hypothetical protein